MEDQAYERILCSCQEIPSDVDCCNDNRNNYCCNHLDKLPLTYNRDLANRAHLLIRLRDGIISDDADV